ncbi:acetate kinase [Propionibacterium sp. oral taxon 192 str. F0372]|uniref:acetate/propionate family kinase n=1 Tax=Propionibacterium sp. oral taxon 192 TaxID=671222 RepID=UPI0003531F86|nr:acetate kinase [Propionibacterium sp. oral taxon 192]EPH06185.1 acetate kinase [Propionibacterium sp. oral taxon 192 str. F0372]
MSKPILVLNCGSSSIKYQMIDTDTEEVLAKGLVQRIATGTTGTIDHEVLGADGGEYHADRDLPDHEIALSGVFELFNQHGPDLSATVAVAHRTVHGGDKFSAPTLLTDEVLDTLVELSPLAPLHNPAGISGIRAARKLLADVPHVGIFDTAFFVNMPAEAYTYAVDTDVAAKTSLRKYGFHGTSHQFVSQAVSQLLGRDDLKQIVAHLGNGASISAVDAGHAVETSMGLTPLAGLVMGTRCGDIDPGVLPYLARQLNLSIEEVDNLLNKKSGMFGLSGHTDMRDVSAAIEAGDERTKLAMDVYTHRLVFYIGGYAALLGGLDALTFTAGVGENADDVRKNVCDRLGFLGVELDEEANKVRSKQPRVISTPGSKVKVLVVPTNEELAMARQAIALID